MPLLKGSVSSVRDAVYAEKTYHERYDPIRAIRTSRFKLIMHFEAQDTADAAIDSKLSPAHEVVVDEITTPNEFVELYDLERDPLELHDVSRDPEYESVLKDLLSRLYGFLKETNDPILNGPIPSPHYYQALRILRGEEQLPPRVQLTPPYQGWWSSLTKSEWDTLMNLIYSQGKESKNKQQ